MSAIAILGGAIVGVGIALVMAGWRGFGYVDVRRWRQRFEGQLTRTGIAVALGVVVLGATGWVVAGVLGAAFGWAAPRLMGGGKRRQADIELTEAIASWAEMLRDTLAGAAGIEGAIAASAQAAPEAIRNPVRNLAARLDRHSLADALALFAEEVNHPTADLVVAALTLSANKAARRLGDLLGSLALAARADATMRLRVDAGRARTRTSVRVVVGATATMALGLLILNRGYLQPYGSAVGQLMLAVVGLCFGFAFWWMERMSRSGADRSVALDAKGATA